MKTTLFLLVVGFLVVGPSDAGTETLENVTVQIPARWDVQRPSGDLMATTPYNSIFFIAGAEPVAPEWVAMADRPGSERDGLFDALTNRAILEMVEVILSLGPYVIEINKDSAAVISKRDGFVVGDRNFVIRYTDLSFNYTTNFTVSIGVDSTHYYAVTTGIESYASSQDLNELNAISASIQTSRPFSIDEARFSSVLLRVVDGQLQFTIDLESSGDLQSWGKAGEFSVTTPVGPGAAEFFRFSLSP